MGNVFVIATFVLATANVCGAKCLKKEKTNRTYVPVAIHPVGVIK